MDNLIDNLKHKLAAIMERSPYQGLLFSGGLDSAILAALNPKAVAITVSLGSEADDIPYAKSLATRLNIKHFHRVVEIDEALESVPRVIKILQSFDPALPNDLAVYFGLKFAKEHGLESVGTGDGADELFAGYSFMKEINGVENYIQRISRRMNFGSNRTGNFFGIKIVQPFMDKSLIDYALQIPVDSKIRKYKGKIWGKWILRKAFEDILPKDVAWQDKRALEYGSGMTKLRAIIEGKISDEEFETNEFPVKFRLFVILNG